MGDPKKAAVWDWAADAVEAEAWRSLREASTYRHESASRALDVVVPYLRRMAQRIEARHTRGDWREGRRMPDPRVKVGPASDD